MQALQVQRQCGSRLDLPQAQSIERSVPCNASTWTYKLCQLHIGLTDKELVRRLHHHKLGKIGHCQELL